MTSARVLLPFLLILSGCGWFPEPAPQIPQRKPLDPDVVAILQYASAGSLPNVRALIEKSPALVNAANYEGETPLYRAVQGFGGQKANVDLVSYLLEKGAHVNPPRRDSACHPLHASIHSDTRILKMLLDHGADVNAKDFYGRTPLDYALGRREVAELLIARGATLTISAAAALGKTRELEKMLSRDAKLAKEIDVWGLTPLHYAARYNYMGAAKVLLKHGADPQQRRAPQRPPPVVIMRGEGPTPIDFAKEKGHQEMVRLLGSKSAR